MSRSRRTKRERRDGTRQHYVPQLLLRKFLDPAAHGTPDPWVWCVDIRGVLDGQPKKPFRRAPKKLASDRGFYDIRSTAVGDEHVEEIYSAIETRAAPFIQMLSDDPSLLSHESRSALSLFVGHQCARTPMHFERSHEAQRALAHGMIRKLAYDREALEDSLSRYKRDHPQSTLTIETLERSLRTNPPTLKESRDRTIGLALQAGEQYAQEVYEANWYLLDAGRESEFITSEYPAHRYVRDAMTDTESFQYVMPVSPKRCLVAGCSDEMTGKIASLSDESTDQFNLHFASVGGDTIFTSTRTHAEHLSQLLHEHRTAIQERRDTLTDQHRSRLDEMLDDEWPAMRRGPSN